MRKNKFIQRKQQSMKNTIILLILIVGLGYALLQSNLNIQGIANMGNPTWDIHWANVQVTEGSVEANTPVIDAAKTTVTYSVVLNIPGEYYEFTVDAVNSGTIDGMIESITSKLNGATITNLPDYLEYTVSYYDGVALAVNHLLAANSTEKYRVRIKYRDDINLNQIPATNQTLTLQFTVKYKQATDNAIAVDHSFNGHSWETIINNIRSGNTNNYNVGDTKTVDMGTLGTHTLRIANKSTPSECSTTGFSQTACGFVLEFADIITTHAMNSTDTNVGGWPASEMRTYVNSDIYNALPTELKNGIINTTVVSSHGNTSGETNFTSTDKMYLLSTKEVWGKEGTANVINYDTAEAETRQLDYYSSQNVTTTNYSGAIKQYTGSNYYWWLRSACSHYSNTFYPVDHYGGWYYDGSNSTNGVSPTFRIG
ncbi:MAG: hypothetical protein IJI58_01335 [Bacilli bacterium]|nr:hypothetical protein [Bacilli bacterium]